LFVWSLHPVVCRRITSYLCFSFISYCCVLHDLTIWVTWQVSYKKQEMLTFPEDLVSIGFCWCDCLLWVSISLLSTILIFYFGIVPTVRYFVSILLINHLDGVLVAIVFSLLRCLFCLFTSRGLCTQYCPCLSIVHSWLQPGFH
jgi:hypothetical protein